MNYIKNPLSSSAKSYVDLLWKSVLCFYFMLYNSLRPLFRVEGVFGCYVAGGGDGFANKVNPSVYTKCIVFFSLTTKMDRRFFKCPHNIKRGGWTSTPRLSLNWLVSPKILMKESIDLFVSLLNIQVFQESNFESYLPSFLYSLYKYLNLKGNNLFLVRLGKVIFAVARTYFVWQKLFLATEDILQWEH